MDSAQPKRRTPPPRPPPPVSLKFPIMPSAPDIVAPIEPSADEIPSFEPRCTYITPLYPRLPEIVTPTEASAPEVISTTVPSAPDVVSPSAPEVASDWSPYSAEVYFQLMDKFGSMFSDASPLDEGCYSDPGENQFVAKEPEEDAVSLTSLFGIGRCPDCDDLLYQKTSFLAGGKGASHVACNRCGKVSTTSYEDDAETSQTRVDSLEMLQRGDHVAWRRSAGAYWHHGIIEEVDAIAGRVLVINYNGEPVRRDGHFASVRREWVSTNLRKKNLYRLDYDPDKCFTADEVLERAASRLGEAKYNPFTENCEHFARWCKTGQHRSIQVETLPVRIRGVPDYLGEILTTDNMVSATTRTFDRGVKAGGKLLKRGAKGIAGKVGSVLSDKAPDIVDFVDRRSDQLVDGLTKADNASKEFTRRFALDNKSTTKSEPVT